MATTTLSVELSSDGTTLTVRDTTPLEEYIGSGIDIDTDIVSMTFKLTENNTSTTYTLDVTSAYPAYLRDCAGYEITTDDLSYTDSFFADGRYTSELVMVENSSGIDNTITSTTDDIFLSQILQVVTSQVIDADWKDLYDPYNNRLSSDLRKRQYIIAIVYSANAGLLDNADSQRKALNKICSYDAE